MIDRDNLRPRLVKTLMPMIGVPAGSVVKFAGLYDGLCALAVPDGVALTTWHYIRDLTMDELQRTLIREPGGKWIIAADIPSHLPEVIEFKVLETTH